MPLPLKAGFHMIAAIVAIVEIELNSVSAIIVATIATIATIAERTFFAAIAAIVAIIWKPAKNIAKDGFFGVSSYTQYSVIPLYSFFFCHSLFFY